MGPRSGTTVRGRRRTADVLLARRRRRGGSPPERHPARHRDRASGPGGARGSHVDPEPLGLAQRLDGLASSGREPDDDAPVRTKRARCDDFVRPAADQRRTIVDATGGAVRCPSREVAVIAATWRPTGGALRPSRPEKRKPVEAAPRTQRRAQGERDVGSRDAVLRRHRDAPRVRQAMRDATARGRDRGASVPCRRGQPRGGGQQRPRVDGGTAAPGLGLESGSSAAARTSATGVFPNRSHGGFGEHTARVFGRQVAARGSPRSASENE